LFLHNVVSVGKTRETSGEQAFWSSSQHKLSHTSKNVSLRRHSLWFLFFGGWFK
jgi:hypothetical protein